MKAEEDEVWDTMETVTEKTKKRAAQKDEATVTGVDVKKKKKLVKKWFPMDIFIILYTVCHVLSKTVSAVAKNKLKPERLFNMDI